MAASNKKRCVVALGAAGSGKSTFINDVMKKNVSNVSSKKNKDGTSGVGTFCAPCGFLELLDTVGLDSKNYHSGTQELKETLRRCNASMVAVVLVCRKNEPRWTSWVTYFLGVIASIFENHPKVIVYWTGNATCTPTDKKDMEDALISGNVKCYHLDDAGRGEFDFCDRVCDLIDICEIKARGSPTVVAHQILQPALTKETNSSICNKSSPMYAQYIAPITFFSKSNTREQQDAARKVIVTTLKENIAIRDAAPNDTVLRATFLGGKLIGFILASIADEQNFQDIENSVSKACTNAVFAAVYTELATEDYHLSSQVGEHVCGNLIQATAWFLSNASGKSHKKAYVCLMSMLEKQLQACVISTSAKPSTLQKCKWRGLFEHFVNSESAPSNKTAKSIMSAVSKAVHDYPGTSVARTAGSMYKHTDVCGYSDLDIFIQSECDITEAKREDIANAVRHELGSTFVSMEFKPVAVGCECNNIDFDLVFEKFASTCKNHGYVTLPCQNDFYHKADRQRAVRALKLLIKLVSRSFYEYIIHDREC
jgi:hypothetical protein